MEVSLSDIKTLGLLINKFEPVRNESSILNDLFEAAYDWRQYAQSMLNKSEQDGWNFACRQQQEEQLYSELNLYYGAELEKDPNFAKVMAIGSRILKMGKARKPHPDGVLGANRIVRTTFNFLEK